MAAFFAAGGFFFVDGSKELGAQVSEVVASDAVVMLATVAVAESDVVAVRGDNPWNIPLATGVVIVVGAPNFFSITTSLNSFA